MKRRRRICMECGKKFTTIEDYEKEVNQYSKGWDDALERIMDFIKEKFIDEELPMQKK